jgi:hypothetical protein
LGKIYRKIKMKASENKFVILKSGFKTTDIIDPVLVGLDAIARRLGIKTIATSGLRDSNDQLDIIRKYLTDNGLKSQFEDTFLHGFDEKITDPKYGQIYAWQLGWSKLLNIGVIVNPPKAAICLLDYMRDGINKKGKLIHESPHFYGTSADLGGGANGIDDELKIVKTAMEEKLPGLVGYLIERKNNAIHCDCEPIKP